jgi:hypothetical protein
MRYLAPFLAFFTALTLLAGCAMPIPADLDVHRGLLTAGLGQEQPLT